jgi:hypothetical protein
VKLIEHLVTNGLYKDCMSCVTSNNFILCPCTVLSVIVNLVLTEMQ